MAFSLQGAASGGAQGAATGNPYIAGFGALMGGFGGGGGGGGGGSSSAPLVSGTGDVTINQGGLNVPYYPFGTYQAPVDRDLMGAFTWSNVEDINNANTDLTYYYYAAAAVAVIILLKRK